MTANRDQPKRATPENRTIARERWRRRSPIRHIRSPRDPRSHREQGYDDLPKWPKDLAPHMGNQNPTLYTLAHLTDGPAMARFGLSSTGVIHKDIERRLCAVQGELGAKRPAKGGNSLDRQAAVKIQPGATNGRSSVAKLYCDKHQAMDVDRK